MCLPQMARQHAGFGELRPAVLPERRYLLRIAVDQQGVAHITGEHVGDTWR